MKSRTEMWLIAVYLCIALLPRLVEAQATQIEGYRILHSFVGAPDGWIPFAGVVSDASGNLYGATYNGGVFDHGSVFEVDRVGRTTHVLYSFAGKEDGRLPEGGVVRDAEGTLYGTTLMGGTLDRGTVFKLKGTEKTVLHSFTGGSDGDGPTGDLVLDAAGNLYGTTIDGGTGSGTIFRVDANDVETVLFRFRGSDGATPNGSLVFDNVGNLYGATIKGGAYGDGTVFKLDTSGSLSVLYSFTGGKDGALPEGGVVLDPAGNLYGENRFGGDPICRCGTIFKVDTNGSETVLYTFKGEKDGELPAASVIRDAAGNLYGTAEGGGVFGYGTVFRLTEAGEFSVLHSFNQNDGAGPYAGLIQDAEGDLYGTTAAGGELNCGGGGGCGVVFKLTPSVRDVSGTRIGHYKNGPVPVDLSATTVAAYVPDGSGYGLITGRGAGDGSFAISSVPGGSYLLQLGSIFLWTRNNVVDADFQRDFRSTVVKADSNTTMTFDLTHLRAWRSTDFFEIVSPNNATWELFPGTVGETAFTGTFPYIGNLSDASQGDQYYMLQLITQKVKGYPFTALGRFIAPPKFSQQQGSDTAIDGKLKSIPQTEKFEANINGADIAGASQAANPNAILFDTTVGVSVYPGKMSKGFATSTPDLVAYDFYSSQRLITTNADLGQILYGNPFPPAKWTLYGGYSYTAATPYMAPGATNGTNIGSLVQGSTTTLPTTQNPMKLLIGVVQNPSINGKNFFHDRSDVGTTPLLKWSPPSVGTATFYEIRVYELTNNAGNTVATLTFTLRTQNTSLTIPPGRLTAGLGYVFVVRPYYVPGLNFSKTPFMSRPTVAWTDVLSGMMQP